MNSENPVVSIIMSAYNSEKYIGDAIESILNQTFEDWELLIADDCSTDNSVNIIESYKDCRISLLKNNINRGLTKNLNVLLDLSRGNFIARLDADDICAPNRLEAQYNYLEHHEETFFVFSSVSLFGDNERVIIAPPDYEHVKTELLFGNPITHSSVMFRNTREYHYDEAYVKSQDYELWDRMVAEGKIIEPMKDILVYQRIHSGQITKVDTAGQETLNSQVIIRSLSRLGITLSDYERQVYIDAIRKETIKTDTNWYIFKNILDEVELQNKQKKIYKASVLKNEISKYYVTLIKSVIRDNIFTKKILCVKNISSCLTHVGFWDITKYLWRYL